MLVARLKKFIASLNEKGVPMPMIRVNGAPSMTATFTFLAFNNALLGQIGKITNLVGPVDLTSANYLFFGCLLAHTSKKFLVKKDSIGSSSDDGQQ